MNKEKSIKNGMISSAKEVARTAVFVALVVGAQYVLSALPFVEVVTLLFVCYSYVFGAARGVVAAVAFAALRQFLFGFFPVIFFLYVLYFPLLCVVFGNMGKRCRVKGWRLVALAVAVAVFCTVLFSLADNLLTPLYYAYSPKAAKMYFRASLPFLVGQSVCVAVTVAFLFRPLTKALYFIKNS